MWKWKEKAMRLILRSGTDISMKPDIRAPRYYTPLAARTPSLVAILVTVLACVAVLETAFRQGTRGHDDGTDLRDRRWIRRQENPTSIPVSSALQPTASSAGTTITPSTSETTSETSPDPTPTSTSDSNIFTSTPLSIPTPSIELTLPATNSGDIAISTALDTSRASVQSTSSTDYISLSTAASGNPTVDTAPASRADMSGVVLNTEASAYLTIATSYTSDGEEHTSVGVDTVRATGISAAQSYYHTISTTATTSASVATITDNLQAPTTVKASQIQIGTTFTEVDYFNSSYLAVLITVAFKMIWAIVFSNFKMMEPFYQLARPDGASAKHSLLAEYFSTGYSINHVGHIFSGHWIMLLTTLTYICIGLLAPLATESMTVISTAYCTSPTGRRVNCNPVWVLDYPIARALQIILILIAVMILVLIILHCSRKSGIFSNPSSIASMASLISHEETLNDFRQLDQSADTKALAAALAGTNYTLSSYEISPGSGMYRCGLIKTSSSSYSSSSPYGLGPTHNFDFQSRNEYSSLPGSSTSTLGRPPITCKSQPFNFYHHLIRDGLFFSFLTTLFSVILAYYLDGSNSGFNRFFNSNTFGPRFILTSATVIIDFHWKTLEREVRILVPYLRLGQCMAKPELSILVNISGTPVQSLPSALWRGEWFHALIAFTALLSDVLIISVAGVPHSSAQIWTAFLASAYLSLAILGWMLLAMVGIFVWRRRVAELRLPREPDTLLSVWMMLADEGNGVRREFDGWETTAQCARDRAAKGRHGKYWGGWCTDETESWRWSVGVDRGERIGDK